MSLNSDERRVMVELEMERADRIMSQIPTLIENEFWDNASNRLYYAAFHAVSALLIRNEIQVTSHKGAILMLNRDFVNKGILTREEGRLFSRLETMRENGDYNCSIETTREEVVPFVEVTQKLIERIRVLVSYESAE